MDLNFDTRWISRYHSASQASRVLTKLGLKAICFARDAETRM